MASQESKDLFSVYEEYSKNLRTWFIGFGIGGLVLILSNKDIVYQLMHNGYPKATFAGFVAGMFFQIMLAMINKYTNWANYYFETYSKTGCLKDLSDWISRQIWIDILLDIGTIVAFLLSGVLLLFSFDLFK